MQTYRINRFIIKLELNENRFFLWTKFLIKIKTRDKKLTKKSHGGGQFSLGAFFLEPQTLSWDAM